MFIIAPGLEAVFGSGNGGVKFGSTGLWYDTCMVVFPLDGLRTLDARTCAEMNEALRRTLEAL